MIVHRCPRYGTALDFRFHSDAQELHRATRSARHRFPCRTRYNHRCRPGFPAAIGLCRRRSRAPPHLGDRDRQLAAPAPRAGAVRLARSPADGIARHGGGAELAPRDLHGLGNHGPQGAVRHVARLASRQVAHRSRRPARAHARRHDARLEPADAQGTSRARAGDRAARRRRFERPGGLVAPGARQVRPGLIRPADLPARRQLGKVGDTSDGRFPEGAAHGGPAGLATAVAADRLCNGCRRRRSRRSHAPPRSGRCRGDRRQLLVARMGRAENLFRFHRPRACPGYRVRGLRAAVSARGEQAGTRH